MWKEFWGWFIDQYIYNTVVTVAVIIIIVNFLKRYKVFQDLGKYKKIKVGAGGVELERDKEGDSEKDKQQDDIIASIKDELKEIKKRLDAQYAYIRDAAVNAGIGVVWAGTNPPFEETIRAGLKNIMLGENGNLVNRMVAVIKEKGKDGVTDYRSELNKFMKDNFAKAGKEVPKHFMDTINLLEAEIH